MMLMARRLSVLIPTMVMALSLTASAQPDLATIGPAVGGRVPEFSGVDQFGRTQTLQSVAGPQGTMLVFFRSADW
jgi:hypothetical protein